MYKSNNCTFPLKKNIILLHQMRFVQSGSWSALIGYTANKKFRTNSPL
jgi:hypothetical protein